jgi:hypothetical protein
LNQFPDEDVTVTPLPISWEADASPDEQVYFDDLVQSLGAQISPGDSLKEIRVIADHALVSEIRALAGNSYQPGQHYPNKGVTIPDEHESTFSSTILITRAFFTLKPIEQISLIVEELYHCLLYHLAWHRRGYIKPHSADLYATDLFTMCALMHDEYAVARLKNTFFGEGLSFTDAQGQSIPPHFIEYGASLSLAFAQADYELRSGAFQDFAPAERKENMIPFAYRFIFEPLARHTGLLMPIPPQYTLQSPENIPEVNDFYCEVVAPYWLSMKHALEWSFDSQFTETEAAIQTITHTMDECFDRLLLLQDDEA